MDPSCPQLTSFHALQQGCTFTGLVASQVSTTGNPVNTPALSTYTFHLGPWPIPHTPRACCQQLISGTNFYISQDFAATTETNSAWLKQGEKKKKKKKKKNNTMQRRESMCVTDWKDPEVACRTKEEKPVSEPGCRSRLFHASWQQQEPESFSDWDGEPEPFAAMLQRLTWTQLKQWHTQKLYGTKNNCMLG